MKEQFLTAPFLAELLYTAFFVGWRKIFVETHEMSQDLKISNVLIGLNNRSHDFLGG